MFNMTCKEKEMDFELKMAKAKETTEKQPTLIDLYKEMNRLKLENECLKADNSELQKENVQLRSDINVLHNKLNVEENYNDETLFEGNNPNDEYDEGLLAFAYTMVENEFKFGGQDMKINE